MNTNFIDAELGIYKRKEESKTRKHAFDQESEQEKRKREHALDQESDQEKTLMVKQKKKENTLSTKKATKKKRKTFFLFFLLSCSFYKFSPLLSKMTIWKPWNF